MEEQPEPAKARHVAQRQRLDAGILDQRDQRDL
jgi:hypothetical protein